MSFLEIHDLTYSYINSEIPAVDAMNLSADRGEIIAVIGPNAAGKSTFALLLKGLLEPESGKIIINGKERVNSGPDPGIGILFPNPENQLVTSIVEEDVAFGLEVQGELSHVIERKVENVLDRLGINHLRKRMPHLLSGGEQQMAALAGVLVMDPDILILDEPTSYLDPAAKFSVLASIQHLADQGKMVFLITHDMKEAAIADRVILLDAGFVAADGVPEEVFAQPGLADRYGIHPPFLLSVLMELRSIGVDVKWPADAASLADILTGILKDPLEQRQTVAVQTCPSENSMPAVVFDQVGFSYGLDTSGKAAVLRGVDFSVVQGSIALICGANGSGKSTLLQMSNGLVTPDSGQVLLSGQQLRTWRKRRGGISGKVALLFQNPERQIFSATVYDDIAFGPRNMGLNKSKTDERVMKAARWAGLPDTVLRRPVFTLSGGQLRRAAVAGVLAMEAEVLVLDEPTDGLDPGSAMEFFNSVRNYCNETGTTVIMATHAVPEQIAMIDHFGHLADGRMQSAGAPSCTLTGAARTLPRQFLPDHLILIEELLDRGIPLSDGILDPASAREQLLVLAKGVA